MDASETSKFIEPYSPWLTPAMRDDWEESIPTFRRPVFYRLVDDLCSIDQIISITGPRRVGKSTLLQQIVHDLLHEHHVDPSHVVYYSFDDPALSLRNVHGGDLIESLMERMRRAGTPAYLLLDEIQTLERWEQYLKKYYDLKYPVRVVVSGSASSPIFKKSRESLLGRVKDYHVLPFSFREFLLYRLHSGGFPEMVQEVEQIHAAGNTMKGMFARSPEHVDTRSVSVPPMSDALWDHSQAALNEYLVDGGFPEVWKLPTADKKIEYLYDNQVKKVIYEDLVLATEFRKPEQLKTFYISLLERPGQEVNLTSLSNDIGVNVQQIDKYLPLLEMTDLLAHAGKFRSSPVRVRKGSRKYYLVDLALRNAVLRIGKEILDDSSMLGLYAENLVFNVLKRWNGVLQMDYFREGDYEIDFVVHTRPSQYFIVEVKYQNQWSAKDVRGLFRFAQRYKCHIPFVVTKARDQFGSNVDGVFRCPLPQFLVLFD